MGKHFQLFALGLGLRTFGVKSFSKVAQLLGGEPPTLRPLRSGPLITKPLEDVCNVAQYANGGRRPV